VTVGRTRRDRAVALVYAAPLAAAAYVLIGATASAATWFLSRLPPRSDLVITSSD
jgi:hypothetical protein